MTYQLETIDQPCLILCDEEYTKYPFVSFTPKVPEFDVNIRSNPPIGTNIEPTFNDSSLRPVMPVSLWNTGTSEINNNDLRSDPIFGKKSLPPFEINKILDGARILKTLNPNS